MLNRIKKICKEKNIAYKDLSDMTGISISTLGKIMSAVIKEPSIITVSKIARALNVSVDYLIYGEYDSTLKQREERELLEKYNVLNYLGKIKVDEYITDLLENKKYTVAKTERPENISFSQYEIAAYGADGTEGSYTPPTEEIT